MMTKRLSEHSQIHPRNQHKALIILMTAVPNDPRPPSWAPHDLHPKSNESASTYRRDFDFADISCLS
jgi:hypothetical protein